MSAEEAIKKLREERQNLNDNRAEIIGEQIKKILRSGLSESNNP